MYKQDAFEAMADAIRLVTEERDRLRAERDTALANWESQKAETDCLRAENEELKRERDEWRSRASILWHGYRLTERMNMPALGRWFSGEGEK